jgi:hypothetical protein
MVPMDIKDYEGKLTISDTFVTDISGNDYLVIKVACDSEVDLVNTHLNSKKFNYGYMKLKDGNRSFIFDVFSLPFLRGGEFDNSQAYKYRQIMLTGDELSKGDEFECGFGDKILTKNKSTRIFLTNSLSNTVSGSNSKLEINNFLTVGGKIIFPNVKETDINSDSSEYKTLSAGYKGEEVVAFKERMVELGYFKNISSVNDTFTASTAEYFKEFQKINGLPVTGVADSETLKLFYSDKAKPKP